MNGTRLQRNRLYELFDDAPTTTGDDIVAPTGTFDNSTAGVNANNNYRYDALGYLIRDERAEIHAIDWTVAGKVRGVERTLGSTLKPLQFAYGASGQRIMKQVGQLGTDAGAYREHYIRDAQGNIMATYRYTNDVAASLKLNERPLYGSSRLGSLRKEEELHSLPSFDSEEPNPVQQVDLNYELTDHLGNVCAVVTGRLLDGNGGGTPKQAELISAQGYEPFGSLLPGRNFSSDSYRFGFGGMPKDDEVHGATGTSYDYGARLLDVRVGRWLSIDRMAQAQPGWSPYRAFLNSPISVVDKDGNIERDAKTGRIIFHTKNPNATIPSGDGELNSAMVRGALGYITANDGKTQLPVMSVAQVQGIDYVRSSEENRTVMKWGSGSADMCAFGTNCYGTVLTNGDYLMVGTAAQFRAFLVADGYALQKAAGQSMKGNFAVGDVLLFGGQDHTMRVVGHNESGAALFESRFAGDEMGAFGTLEQVQQYHANREGQQIDIKSAELFRPTIGDVYKDEAGKVVRTSDKKTITNVQGTPTAN